MLDDTDVKSSKMTPAYAAIKEMEKVTRQNNKHTNK